MKKQITITLQIKEIIYDIQNKTYLTGRSREAEEAKGFEAASHMQVSDDDENSYQIRRSLNNAYADLKTAIAEYCTETSVQTNNLIKQAIDNDTSIDIVLSMPGNYNAAATDNLGSAIHRYLVDRAIADWFDITNKTEAQGYRDQAIESILAIKRALYKRGRPIRPTSTD